jgi:cytochrome P450
MPAMADTDELADGPVDPADGRGPAELDVAGYLADPDAELRRCAAQHWWARGMDETGAELPIVLDLDGSRRVLRDRRLSTRSFTDDMVAAGLSERTAHQLTPLFRRHGDAHRQFRGLLSAAFTPRSVERLRPFTAAVAERFTQTIAERDGRCEFVAAFAAPLPPEVFATLFGLPVEERDRLARWGAIVTDAFVPSHIAERADQIESATAEMRDWSAELIAQRRVVPQDDLITGLLAARVGGERLGDDDITDVITGFVFAGSETTRRQLTRAVQAFAEHPEAWQRLVEDPSLIDGAVEEILRRYSIIPGLSRVAAEQYDDGDLTVCPGARVATTFVTANVDPAVFSDPERFDVGRANAKEHLSFGWGPHFCMGAPLARMELQESLRALTAAFGPPSLVAESDGDAATGFGAPDELHVRFARRGDRL